MEVILIQDVRSLGSRGDTVRVKPGYARNFLLPQGLALEASKGNRAYYEHQRKKIDARHTRERDAAAAVAAELAGLTVKIAKRVGESEVLYGSVTSAEIVEALAAKGIEVDKRRLHLDEGHTLKTLGEHKITIDLHPEVIAEVTVAVVPEEG